MLENNIANRKLVLRSAAQLRGAESEIRNFVLLCTLMIGCVSLIGCAGTEEVPVNEYLPEEQEPFEAFGIRFDQGATPQQVTYALLKAIHQDCRAGFNHVKRKEALRLQCKLAHVDFLRQKVAKRSRRRAGAVDDTVLRLIRGWAPILNYYAEYFDDDFAQAQTRMKPPVRKAQRSPEMLYVNYVLPAGRFGGPAELARGVTIRVTLAKTSKGYWRVVRVGYGSSPDLQLQATWTTEHDHGS